MTIKELKEAIANVPDEARLTSIGITYGDEPMNTPLSQLGWSPEGTLPFKGENFTEIHTFRRLTEFWAPEEDVRGITW